MTAPDFFNPPATAQADLDALLRGLMGNPSASPELLPRLTAATLDRSGLAGRRDLPGEAAAVPMRKLDDHLGGADTYRTYAAELEATAGLIQDASYDDEPVVPWLACSQSRRSRSDGHCSIWSARVARPTSRLGARRCRTGAGRRAGSRCRRGALGAARRPADSGLGSMGRRA